MREIALKKSALAYGLGIFALVVIVSLFFVVFTKAANQPMQFEIEYPFLPTGDQLNADTLQKAESPVPILLKYILNFSLYISAGVAVIFLVWAGVLYITAQQRPNMILKARALLQRGLTGFLIVLSAFALMNFINPDLLLFRLDKDSLKAPPSQLSALPSDSYVFQQIPLGGAIDVILTELTEKESPNVELLENIKPTDIKVTQNQPFYKVAFGSVKNTISNGVGGIKRAFSFLGFGFAAYPTSQLKMERYIVPFYEAKEITAKLFYTTQQLKELEDCCTCGNSKVCSQIKVQTLGEPECSCVVGAQVGAGTKDSPFWCRGGQECENEALACIDFCKDVQGATGQQECLDGCKKNYGAPEDCWACKEVCSNCSCDTSCFFRVFNKWKNHEQGVPDDWQETFVWQDPPAPQEILQFKRDVILDLVAKLQVLKSRIAYYQTKLQLMAVDLHKVIYLQEQGEVPLAEAVVDYYKTALEKGGPGANMFLSKVNNNFLSTLRRASLAQGEANNVALAAEQESLSAAKVIYVQLPGGILGRITKQRDYLTFYILTATPQQGQTIKIIQNISRVAELAWKNNETVINANAQINWFALIALESVEEFRKLIEQCLKLAFGEIDIGQIFGVADDDPQKKDKLDAIFAEMVKTAVESGISQQISVGMNAQGVVFVKALDEATQKDMAKKAIKACEAKCQNKEIDINKDNNPDNDIDTDECKRRCNNIKHGYLSRKATEFLTTPVYALLPGKELEKIFDETLYKVLFEGKRNIAGNYLDQSILSLLQRGIGQSAQTSLAELIPGMMAILQTRILEKMPSFVADAANFSVKYLSLITDGLQKRINDKIEDFIKNQTKAIQAKIDTKWFPKDRAEADALLRKLQAPQNISVNGLLDEYADEKIIFNQPRFNEACKRDFGRYFDSGKEAGPANDIGVFCQGLWQLHMKEVESQKGKAFVSAMTNLNMYSDMFKDWGSALWDSTMLGFKALPGQFFSALLQTASHTATKYTQAIVNDEIITPLLTPYMSELVQLRDLLKRFMQLTVQDLLPDLIKNALQRTITQNLEALLSAACNAAKTTPNTDGEVEVKVKLYGDTAGWSQWMPQDKALQACHLNYNLHQELKDKLPQAMQDLLQKTLKDLLKDFANCPPGNQPDKYKAPEGEKQEEIQEAHKSWCKFIDGTTADVFAYLIFGKDADKEDVINLINASAKSLFCGEIAMHAAGKSPKELCGIPQQQDGELIFNIPQARLDKYPYLSTYCKFQYNVCQAKISEALPMLDNPFAYLLDELKKKCDANWKNNCKQGDGFAGSIKNCDLCAPNLTSVLRDSNKGCIDGPFYGVCKKYYDECWEYYRNLGVSFNDNDVEKCINRKLLDYYQPNQTMCSFCNTVFSQTGLYSIIWYQAKTYTESIFPASFNDAYPQDKTNYQTTIDKELRFYQWVYIVIPQSYEELDQVAKRRNLASEWAKYRNEIYDYANFNALPDNLEKALMVGVDAVLVGRNLKEILIAVPFGVIKPVEKDKDTLLYKKGESGYPQSTNFLSRTPYYFLLDVCHRLTSDCKNDKDTYSNCPSIEKTCEFLQRGKNEHLGKMLGLDDKKLVEYAGGYQGAFNLLYEPVCSGMMNAKNCVKQDEVPPTMYNFLALVHNNTPLNAFCSADIIGIDSNDPGKAALCDTLRKSPSALTQKKLADFLIEAFCKTANNANQEVTCKRAFNQPLDKLLGVKDEYKWFLGFVNQYLDKTPDEFFRDPSLWQKILDWLFTPDDQRLSKDILNKSIAENFANYNNWFKKPLVDIIGEFFGWDIFFKQKLDAWSGWMGSIDEGVKTAKNTIQGAFEAVLLEAPEAMLLKIADSFNAQFLAKFSNQLFMSMTEGCDYNTPKDKCLPPRVYVDSGDIKYQGQCCDLGSTLACVPKVEGCKECRLVPENLQKSACLDFETLEDETDASGKKTYRCCRTLREKEGKCCQTVSDCITQKINTFILDKLIQIATQGPSNDSAIFLKQN